MSKAIKTIASIALPAIGNYIAPGIGGAIGGAIAGGISGGGLKGVALGALGGYASGSLSNGIIGEVAHTLPAGVSGPVSPGSGILGAVTGGGARALGASISNFLPSSIPGATQAGGAAAGAVGGISDTGKYLMGIGNTIMTQDAAATAEKAAKIQAGSINNAIATQQPYQQLGTDAVNQINQIQADPGGYIQNNPFYASLADDAQRRLSAAQGSKGKFNSGGTIAALQDNLLQLGNGLVQQQVGTLQQQAGIGQNAANNVSNFQTQQGDVLAAGKMGASNAMTAGYQNQINTLLAMQGLGNTPTYQPQQMRSI